MSSSAENLVYDNSGRIVAADGQLRTVGHVRADGGEANVLVHGLAIQYWTVNSEKDMAYLASVGADALISDYPERAAEVLRGQQ